MTVRFISRYKHENHYGVHLPRLGREVRVRLDTTFDRFLPMYDDQTAAEYEQAIAAVRAFIATTEAEAREWLAARGLAYE